MRLKADLSQLTSVLKGEAKQRVKKIDRALYRAAQRGRRLLVKRTPVGVAGQLRAAWSEPRQLPNGQLGYEVVNDAPHAATFEYGSRPHMPPVEPLILWAQRKFGLSPAEAKKAGWAVAIKIKAEGTPPHHIASGAERELQQFVLEEVLKVLREREGGDGE